MTLYVNNLPLFYDDNKQENLDKNESPPIFCDAIYKRH